jgi:cellulose synthase/poly-beta-1,6-N-acetylglucosamine synthase-like glycosyltransferase
VLNTETPTFSIVIAAYQAVGTIGAAVESALAQTLPPHEVIVVDDGSTDDLEGALEPFGEAIALVRKENGGGASARNAGLAVATGEFMAILDADDAYDPRRLEAIAKLARERPGLDLLATDARFVVNGRAVGRFLEHNPFPVGDQRTAILASCFPGGWPAVRVRALREVGGFDERLRIAYDWDCWLRMVLAGSAAGMVEEPLYDYTLHGGSLASARVASLWERVAMLEKAAGNPSLRPAERPALERSLSIRREQAARAGIEATLYGGLAGGELRRLAVSRDLGWRLRCLAAMSLVAAPLARRFVTPSVSPQQRFG